MAKKYTLMDKEAIDELCKAIDNDLLDIDVEAY